MVTVDGARVAVAAAGDRLLVRAPQIIDPSVRATFLEAVPENARTLALARAWSGEPVSRE